MRTTLLTTVTTIALLAGTSLLSAQSSNMQDPTKADPKAQSTQPAAKSPKSALGQQESTSKKPSNMANHRSAHKNKAAAASKASSAKQTTGQAMPPSTTTAAPKGDIGAGLSGTSNRIRHSNRHRVKHPSASMRAPSGSTTGQAVPNAPSAKNPKGDVVQGSSGTKDNKHNSQ